jgi:Uncharacterized phage-associated protein
MANVFDVAKYVLNKTGEISTMKLQKLVYYCQAWSLAWDEVPLFEEDFQAWANGPVCVPLFDFHRGKFVINTDFLSDKANIDHLSKTQRETIDAVLEDLGDKESQWLSNLTHMEAPWKNARKGIPPGIRGDQIISKADIQEYYLGIYTTANANDIL